MQFKLLLALGLALRLLTAVFSEGYWHPDEYFQIFEPLHFLRGHSLELPWEWQAQIRPLLQVNIYRVLLWPFESILNPFNQILFTRMAMGMASAGAFLFWAVSARSSGFLNQKNFERVLFYWAFLGFLPFLAVRTSSETAGAILFFLSFGFWEKLKLNPKRFTSLSFGFLVALCFYLRFQMGFAFLGLGLWILIYRPKILKDHGLQMATGFSIGFFLGLLSDRIGYGNWVFSPWNYFKANILEGAASHFGVEPLWGYVRMVVTQYFPWILFLFGSWLLFLKNKFKSEISFLTLAFFVAHSLVGHKEFRFISFIFWFSPLFLAHLEGTLATTWPVLWRWTFRIGMSLSTVYLLVGFFPIRSEMGFYRQFVNRVPSGSRIEVAEGTEIPFRAHGLALNFLGYKGFQFIVSDGAGKPESHYSFSKIHLKTEHCKLLLVKNEVPNLPFDLDELIINGGKIKQGFLYECNNSQSYKAQ